MLTVCKHPLVKALWIGSFLIMTVAARSFLSRVEHFWIPCVFAATCMRVWSYNQSLTFRKFTSLNHKHRWWVWKLGFKQHVCLYARERSLGHENEAFSCRDNLSVFCSKLVNTLLLISFPRLMLCYRPRAIQQQRTANKLKSCTVQNHTCNPSGVHTPDVCKHFVFKFSLMNGKISILITCKNLYRSLLYCINIYLKSCHHVSKLKWWNASIVTAFCLVGTFPRKKCHCCIAWQTRTPLLIRPFGNSVVV